jgi:DNA-binding NarL/FixJ family response regulator
MAGPMRVLLVDDHPLFRQALAATIATVDRGIVVEQFDSLATVGAALGADGAGALVLLDLKLPDSRGVSGLLSLQARFPDVPIAIVSARDDPETVHTAIACGAAGFIPKASGLADLGAALAALLRGGRWFPDGGGEETRGALTPTQARILDGLHRGLMNKQIAFELGLTEATVKYHLTGLFRKLGVQTRSQLTALARDGAPSS